jgi:hypothetical protein
VGRRRAPVRPCSVSDCESPVEAMGMCSLHYERVRTGGSADGAPREARGPVKYRHLSVDGYWVIKASDDHPLVAYSTRTPSRRAWLAEHRVVLFDAIGPGAHPCHWCARPVRWDRSWAKAIDGLVVDHLNDVKTDNRIENLVASCGVCNSHRGRLAADAATLPDRLDGLAGQAAMFADLDVGPAELPQLDEHVLAFPGGPADVRLGVGDEPC